MASNWLSQLDYTQICVAHGEASWGSEDNDEAGELQLWYRERDNNYCINARKTARGDKLVCKVIDVFTLHFQKYTDKIKTLLRSINERSRNFISSSTENK